MKYTKPIVRGILIAIIAQALGLEGIESFEWWCFVLAMNVMVIID